MSELSTSQGELVVLDLPPGRAMLDAIARSWRAGVAFLPLDARLTPKERREILDRARPTAVVSSDDETIFAGATPIDPAIGTVVATSGTAGTPKLVELPRTSVEAVLEGSNRASGIDPLDPWIACLNPGHIGGLLVYLRHAELGTPVTVLDWNHSGSSKTGAHVSLVPTMLARSVTAGSDLSRVGTILVGGAALDDHSRDAATRLGGRVVSTYGLTETCGGVAYEGRLFEGTRARLGVDDEVELLGPTLMEGYRLDPQANGAAFTSDGWLRTGDAATIDDEGLVHVRGRLDHLIRTGAEKVWPEEVERALRDHPKVSEVAVVGAPHEEWGQQVIAYVVPASRGDPPTLEELRDHASDRIARFKAPREVVIVAELPRTSGRKLRRGAFGSG